MTHSNPLSGVNSDQANFWTSGPGRNWAAEYSRLDAIFAPIKHELLARAALEEGVRVLDIGCGAGDTTLAAASAVGGQGQATGLDISETLLAVARKRAAEAGCGADFILADAQTHDFVPGAYDHLISRFGLMFFADPVAGFTNLARALKPGARVTFVTWAREDINPWNRDAKAVGVARLGPVPTDPPRTPGQFAFAEIDYVTDILAAAGYTGIAGEEVESHLHIAGDAEVAADLATQIGPVSRIMREHRGSAEDRMAIAADLARILQAYEEPGAVRVPAILNFFSARRP